MYDAAVALRDAMIELEVAVDGGKDSLSMAAAAGEQSSLWLWWLWQQFAAVRKGGPKLRVPRRSCAGEAWHVHVHVASLLTARCRW